MDQRSSARRIVEILLFTISSLFLFLTGLGSVLFLVPLQMLASRRGMRGLVPAAGVFLAVFAGLVFGPWAVSPGGPGPDLMTFLSLGVIVLLIAGLVLMNVLFRTPVRRLTLMLIASGVTGLISFPVLLALSRDPEFLRSLDQLFAEAARVLASVLSTASATPGDAASLPGPSALRQMVMPVVLPGLMADYAGVLAFSWWAGQATASRARVSLGLPPAFRFSGFRLPGRMLWPLIASAALVLADLYLGAGSAWGYAAWNAGILVLLLYGLQGMAVIWFQFEKYRLPRFLWLILVAGIASAALSGTGGIFVLLAPPLLGVSENWIRLRVPRSAEPTEQG
jgi:hypothetical protein